MLHATLRHRRRRLVQRVLQRVAEVRVTFQIDGEGARPGMHLRHASCTLLRCMRQHHGCSCDARPALDHARLWHGVECGEHIARPVHRVAALENLRAAAQRVVFVVEHVH